MHRRPNGSSDSRARYPAAVSDLMLSFEDPQPGGGIFRIIWLPPKLESMQ